jgi:hypothetical protein
MLIVICMLIWPAIAVILCLFSFFVGRCGRPLPVVDDHLPWTIHRSVIPYSGRADAPRDAAIKQPRSAIRFRKFLRDGPAA